MSVKIMSLVWERAPYSEGSLLVLLALADWADDNGVSWPSVPKIAQKARLQRRRVQYIIRKLESDGFVDIEDGGGRNKQHRYALNIEKLKGAINAPYIENPSEINSALNAPFSRKGALSDMEGAHFGAETVHSETQRAHSSAPDPLEEPLERPSREPSVDLTPAGRIFVCWKETMGHPKARLDSKRRDLINHRLKDGYTVDDLCIAIRGCSESAFHMGKNDRNTKYNDITLICRDAKHVDQFLEIAQQGNGNGYRLRGALTAADINEMKEAAR